MGNCMEKIFETYSVQIESDVGIFISMPLRNIFSVNFVNKKIAF